MTLIPNITRLQVRASDTLAKAPMSKRAAQTNLSIGMLLGALAGPASAFAAPDCAGGVASGITDFTGTLNKLSGIILLVAGPLAMLCLFGAALLYFTGQSKYVGMGKKWVTSIIIGLVILAVGSLIVKVTTDAGAAASGSTAPAGCKVVV